MENHRFWSGTSFKVQDAHPHQKLGEDRILHLINYNYYSYNREKMYFTVQPESMLVKIEHAVLATKFLRGKGVKDLAASQRNMRGFLYSHNGTILKRQYNYLPVSSFQDK